MAEERPPDGPVAKFDRLEEQAQRLERARWRLIVIGMTILGFVAMTVGVLSVVNTMWVRESNQDVKRLVASDAEDRRQRLANELEERERAAGVVSAALDDIEAIIVGAVATNDVRAHERYLDLVARLDAIRCAPGTPAPPPPPVTPSARRSPPPPRRSPPPPSSPAVRPPPPPPPAPSPVTPAPGLSGQSEDERRGPASEKGKGKGPPAGRGPNR